jgi:hypothetical protein
MPIEIYLPKIENFWMASEENLKGGVFLEKSGKNTGHCLTLGNMFAILTPSIGL